MVGAGVQRGCEWVGGGYDFGVGCGCRSGVLGVIHAIRFLL